MSTLAALRYGSATDYEVATAVDSFFAQRLAAVQVGKGMRQIKEGPLCVVHLAPLASIRGQVEIPIKAMPQGLATGTALPLDVWHGGLKTSFNVDGLLLDDGTEKDQGAEAYLQVFRDGRMEAVTSIGDTVGNTPAFSEGYLAGVARNSLRAFASLAQHAAIKGTAFASCAVVNAGDYRLADSRNRISTKREQRASLIAPAPHWIEDVAQLDVDVMFSPLLDHLWQGLGLRCANWYDAGEFKGYVPG
jgi:hypothetical protein